MEQNGIAVDTNILANMSRSLGDQIRVLEKEICDLAGQTFNINSPQQLGMILADVLHLEGVKKEKRRVLDCSRRIGKPALR